MIISVFSGKDDQLLIIYWF